MPSKSKRKGNGYEREIKAALVERGWTCERAYGSNGRALGEVDECDNKAVSPYGNATVRIQAKRRGSIAAYLYPPEGTDVVFLREDRAESLAVLQAERYLELVEAVDLAHESSVFKGMGRRLSDALHRVLRRHQP